MRYKQKFKYVTMLQFNKIVSEQVDDFRYQEFPFEESIKLYYGTGYLWLDQKSNIKLVYKNKSKKRCFIAVDAYDAESEETAIRKTKKEQDGKGGQAYRALNRLAKKYGESFEFPANDDYVDYVISPYDYFDRTKSCQPLEHIYSYDMNSCYPYFLMQELPYGNDLGEGEILEDEYGFIEYQTLTGLKSLRLKSKGYAEHRFKKKKFQCFYDWAVQGFKKKQKNKDYKIVLNALVGDMKYHNIFIRCTVLDKAQHFIESLRDENTLMCTVDSIVSSVPRPDIKLGTEIGDFKLEHEDAELYYESNMVKQFRGERELHAGVSSSRYVNDLEIWNEPRYSWNYTTKQIEKNPVESSTKISKGALLWLNKK